MIARDPKCVHDMSEVKYRVVNCDDRVFFELPPQRGVRETWTCDRAECILDAINWCFTPHRPAAFMYTREHQPITVVEAMKGAR